MCFFFFFHRIRRRSIKSVTGVDNDSKRLLVDHRVDNHCHCQIEEF